MSTLSRKRRLRRQYKQSLQHSKSAKPTHKLIAARTGSKRAHNLKGLKP